MAEEKSKPKGGGGCVIRLALLILLVAGLALGSAVFFILKPQDLSDVGGYGPAAPAPSRDLKVVLKNSLDRGYAVTLTEAEINQWLGRTLAAKQGGVLEGRVSLERLWVRLLDGHAELIMERRIAGRPFTVSMFITIEQIQGAKGVLTNVHVHGGPYHKDLRKPLRGGRFGTLVVPQGYMILIRSAYGKLIPLFAEEIRLGFEEMARIRIEKNRLVLNPREPEGDLLGLPRTF
jgi:hypothetical protein